MKRVFSVLFCVLIVFSCGVFSVSAKQSKITEELNQVIKISDSDVIIPVNVSFNVQMKSREDMPSYPDWDKAVAEYEEYKAQLSEQFCSEVFEGINVQIIYSFGNAVIAGVKASDIEKVAAYDSVICITYEPDIKLNPSGNQSKITGELNEVIKQSDPDEIIPVNVSFNVQMKSREDMPSYPDWDKAVAEYEEYKTQLAEQFCSEVFDGMDVQMIYNFGNAVIAGVKASDIEKVVAYDSVICISYEPDITLGPLGDADKDNELTILDATHIQRYLAELIEISEINLYAADYDKDGAVTILDATAIQRNLAGLTTEI